MKRRGTRDIADSPLLKRANSDSVVFKKAFDSDDDVITFYSKSARVEARTLSNFSGHAVTIDYIFAGMSKVCIYPTGEHAFQGGKFMILGSHAETDSERQQELLRHASRFEGESTRPCMLKTPAAAKKAGGKGGIRLTDTELALWELHTMNLQEQICRQKLRYADVMEFLMCTGEKYLVHYERATGWPRYGACVLAPEKSPFADGRRWLKGDNLLGEMWMRLRKELQESDA
jgi:predicted NAD-dependent protein-ADP-ribosyltransferase YbiA (DUF1768 family)